MKVGSVETEKIAYRPKVMEVNPRRCGVLLGYFCLIWRPRI
jgi:hypothetical protein